MSNTIDYTIEKSIDKVELRRYPPNVLATVRGMPDNEAFRILFRYISGSNRTVSKIEMTVPVISTGQRIAMTAPVVSSDDTFSFMLPSSYSIESSPVPLDPRSTLERIPARRVAALRFRGPAGQSAVAEKRRILLDTLARHDIRPNGEPFLMRYDAPFTPGFVRRNEVGIELAAN
ncbi:MAG: heme-binding protein [Candidatus Dormibacter sp.]